MNGAGGARQGILSLVVKDKAGLYNAYMPYIRQGGIFVPTPRRYFIGDEVFLLLTLPESEVRREGAALPEPVFAAVVTAAREHLTL